MNLKTGLIKYPSQTKKKKKKKKENRKREKEKVSISDLWNAIKQMKHTHSFGIPKGKKKC
jgi:hypothetical protein